MVRDDYDYIEEREIQIVVCERCDGDVTKFIAALRELRGDVIFGDLALIRLTPKLVKKDTTARWDYLEFWADVVSRVNAKLKED